MNKTAIKNFAIWARNKLITDITYKAGLLGISEKGIKSPLPQSTNGVQFFDIGTKEPYSISGIEIRQREALAKVIRDKEKQSDYATAYKSVVEEVAYTWFNRLIAIRFMEVNDYLPSHIRVLSSESAGKDEPDLVTNPFDTDLEFTPYEKDRIMQLKQDNKLDELFRMLFIKQCNSLNALLPNLFEKTSDYTELLLNIAFTDKDGVVYRLVNDISEDDFNVSKEGQVEIIGWLYQYYNTEPKDETFALLKKNVKITKERIPAATQLFTPDWIVRYMVENSLGRLWLERERAIAGVSDEYINASYFGWKYYVEDTEQEPDVQKQLDAIREEYKSIKPEDIKVIDPCMGSGHILVYAFDVLMQIYESYGYSQRDAAKSIVENNLYGLDIDNRAYQLAYFAVMMKARQYNRRILSGEINPHVYAIQESNGIGWDVESLEFIFQSKEVKETLCSVIDVFKDAKDYGSILNIEQRDYQSVLFAIDEFERNCELTLENHIKLQQLPLIRNLLLQAAVMAQKYDVVVTNPPYMGSSGMDKSLSDYVKKEYPNSKSDLFAVFIEKCGQITKQNCYQAMITQHSWMFLSSFEKLREKLQAVDIVNMAHLGARAFEEIGGEVVQTTSWVQRKSNIVEYLSTYIRLVDYGSQYGKEKVFLEKGDLHFSQKENFFKIPGMPIAYWVGKNAISAYDNGKLLGSFAFPKTGMTTGDNNRFLRLWYEVNINKTLFNAESTRSAESSNKKWFPYCKGGGYKRWYGYNEYLVNWQHNGFEIKNNIKDNGLKAASVRSENMYFKKLITWSAVTSGKFSCRNVEGGALFDSGGSSISVKENHNYILALLNSKIGQYYLNISNATINYQPGDIAGIPVLFKEKYKVQELAGEDIVLSKKDWDSYETSWDFIKHPLLRGTTTIAQAFNQWEAFNEKQFNKLKENEEELNSIFINTYGLQDELTPEIKDKDITIRKADLARDIRSFISYSVGCMLGRYSLDVEGLAYAGGQWDDNKYSTFIPDKDNTLPITDEEYFEDDIVGLFVAFVKKVYGQETLEKNLDFIAKALGNKGNSSREIIRNYFVKDFFKDHCKVYQKRPIYWLFDSGKDDGFKALIYMHRYDENTIGNIRVDYLHKMQRVYEREIIQMQETIDNSTNAREVAAAEKRKDKLTKQLKETKDYDEKIAHLALARIAIDLDDGVKVNYEKVQTGTDGKKLEVLAKI